MSILGMIGGGAAGELMDGISGSRDRDRQHAENTGRDAMGRQQEMAKFQYNLDMKKWNDTNYEAQIKQMKKAGLNVGMMYGMGGAGGADSKSTPASGQGGGGNPNQPQMMGIGMQSGINAMQAQANIKLAEAQTGKVKESTKETIVDTKSKSIKLAIEEELKAWELNAQGAETKERAAMAKNNIHDVMSKFIGETGQKEGMNGEYEQGNRREEKYKTEQEGKITKAERESVETLLMEARKSLTDEQIGEVWHRIRQNWAKIGVDGLGKILRGIITKGK